MKSKELSLFMQCRYVVANRIYTMTDTYRLRSRVSYLNTFLGF